MVSPSDQHFHGGSRLNVITELVAANRLFVGDRVRLGLNLKPRCLHSKNATIIAKDVE